MNNLVRLVFIISITALTVSGCFLQSVHPLVFHNDSELVDGLEGVWESEDSKWYFINDLNNFRNYMGSDDRPYSNDSPAQQGSAYFVFYETEYEGVKDTTMFVGSTIELNGNYYLDLFPQVDMEPMVGNHLFPVHTFSKVSVSGDNLKMELFDDEWIRNQIINNRVRLKHEFIGEADQNVLLTASTEELQQFVRKYGNEKNAYADPIILNRIQ